MTPDITTAQIRKRRARKRCEPSGYVAKVSHDQLKQISNMIITIERLGKAYTIEAIADKVAQKKPDQPTRVNAVKVATACKEIINRLKIQNQPTRPL